jgi:hypothetical protein
MKSSLVFTALCLGTVAAQAGAEISQDVEATYGAASASRTNVSPVRNASVSEQSTQFQYVLSYAVPDRPILRLGVGYDRFDFGFAGPGLIPETLQSLRIVTGIDLKISDFLIRIETQPGFYGDNRGFNASDFNAPIVLGISYLASKDLQWIIGLSYDGNRSYPFLGGLGVRWKMSDRWVLNFIPPDPRLEYKATDDLTLFAGAHLITSTFRVNDNFGGPPGIRKYSNAIVEYTEVRTGAGASWKFNGKGTLDVELGYEAYRDFDYHKVGDDFQTKSGAFYGQAGVKLKF